MDIRYAAGFFDGEGCAQIILCRGIGKVNDRYVIEASIGQTDRRPLDALRERFGGGIRAAMKRRIAERTNGVNEYWFWSVSADKALHFLISILPHLIVKREDVECCIAALNERELYSGRELFVVQKAHRDRLKSIRASRRKIGAAHKFTA